MPVTNLICELKLLIVVAFLTCRDSDIEAILLRWKRAGSEGSVDARRVLGAVEVEDQGTRFVEAISGQ